MNTRNLCHCLFILLIAGGGIGCRPAKESGASAGKTKHLNATEKLDLDYLFYNANREKILGNTELAANLFAQCIRIDGTNHAAMYELAQLSDQLGRDKDALFFSKSAAVLDQKNIWYQLLYAALLQKNRMYADAVLVYEKMVKLWPDNYDLYYDLAEAYLYVEKPLEAIRIYNKLEEFLGINPELSMQKQQLYLKAGKFDKAVEELQKLSGAYPGEIKYTLMLADLYAAQKMNEKALDIYDRLLKENPSDPHLQLSLAGYYRNTGDKEKSFASLKKAFASPDLDLDTKINILSSYYALLSRYPELKEQAIELNKLLIGAHPDESRGYAVFGDFLYQDGKYDEARGQYRKALELSKENFLLWQQLFFCESYLNDYPALLKETEEALGLFPAQPTVYLFSGIASIQEKKYKEAVNALNEGAKLVVENKQLLVQFYSNLGDVQYQLKNIAASDSAYDKALSLDPKNTYVLNNYSYYLSLRGENLDKAAAMALLANTLSPDNSSFEDTYGWVLYRQGHYNEAQKWLEKAMQHGGENNPVIIEHYGDVLYKLGQAEKASEYWQKAKAAGKGSDFLEKKVAEKKLYE